MLKFLSSPNNTTISNRISKNSSNINHLKFLICPATVFLSSAVLLCLYISFSLIYNHNKCQEYYRMHVVANSNSTDDLTIKLKVSAILEDYIAHITEGMSNKNEIKQVVTSNMSTIYAITNSCLEKYNANYSCNIKYGNIYYDEKENIYLDMPSGVYDSIQVELGASKGTNFWTTIFPNSSYDKENLKNLKNIFPNIENIENIDTSYNKYNDNINELEYCLEKDDNYNIIYSFKIIEIIHNLLNN